MAGNVIVFNGTSQQMTIILNNAFPAPAMAAAASPGWVPNGVTVPRSPADGNPGILAFGTVTRLSVLIGGGTAFVYTITIPQQANPLNNDVQLYIFYDRAVLVSSGSTTEEPQQTVLKGRAATAKDEAVLKKLKK